MSTPHRDTTRRRFLAGGASALAASTLLPVAPASAMQADRDLIDLLYAQEQALIAHYAATLEAFADSAFADAGLPGNTRAELANILTAEEVHQDVVTRPDRLTTPDFEAVIPDDILDTLRLAAELENLAVATYAFVIPELSRPRMIPGLLGIHSVEARHAAWLGTLLGDDPFPVAIDAPLAFDDPTGDSGAASATPEGPARTPSESALAPIVAAIAEELGVPAADISIVSATPENWPDASLGCPQPDTLYAQVVTPGFLVLVEVAGERIEFHTDEQGNVVRCPSS